MFNIFRIRECKLNLYWDGMLDSKVLDVLLK